MSFDIPPFHHDEYLLKSKCWQYSSNIGDHVIRHKGYEGGLHKLPFPSEPGINTVPKLLERAASKYMLENVYGERNRNDNGSWGDYSFISYGDFLQRVLCFGKGLLQLCPFLNSRDRIGIYGKNSLYWVIAQQALYWNNLTVVPLYDTLGEEAISYIIQHASISVIMVSSENLNLLLKSLKRSNNDLVRTIIVMGTFAVNAPDHEVDIRPFSAVELLGRQNGVIFSPSSTSPTDMALILYTSGTTGIPKGVMLTHGGIISVVAGLVAVFGHLINEKDKHISYLPLAHGFENCLHAFGFCHGCSCGFYHGDVRLLTDDVQVLKPTIFVGVPRVYQRIHQVVMTTFESKPWFLRIMIARALRSQIELHRNNQPRSRLWDTLVFNRVKAALGGRVRLFITGSAPLSPSLQEFMQVCFDAPMFEGYGLTETSAIASVACPGDPNIGHVGPPLPSFEMKLASVPEMGYTIDDKPRPRGEVLLRGPGIMKGYFKDDHLTAEVIEPSGWFHTGDIGQLNPNGTLSIIDRKKNIFKLAQGEYISAERLEGIYLQSKLVGQVCIYGNSYKDCLIAVVVPDPLTLIPWALDKGTFPGIIPFRQPGWKDSFRTLCQSPEVNRAILREMMSLGKEYGLCGFEIPKGVVLESNLNELNQGFNVENGFLTPTFKLKRDAIAKSYKTEIDMVYSAIEAEVKRQS